ncbi:hypothetical protein PIROE2DRAFT_19209 [Piromyces sp. E2]|nr:hypothetical protein PIROE2DRAFT_19209 [Piromyces sp. E2]|eukprot:OUM56254.1 hypothetical protein PIROE2DRAFT_19209 [Piromyces sp. E2]
MGFLDDNKRKNDNNNNYEIRSHWVNSGSNIILEEIIKREEFYNDYTLLSLLNGNVVNYRSNDDQMVKIISNELELTDYSENQNEIITFKNKIKK